MDYPALLARLLPPSSYSLTGARLSAELSAEGAALTSSQSYASRVAAGVLPDGGTTELLPDWERVYGITPASSATISSRVAAIQARMRAVGGLSRAYFIEIAAALGYTITISELTPFRASRNRVGDVIAVPGVVYAWRVSVYGVASAPDLEALFRELKPAHTAVTFVYPAGSLAGAMSGSITVGTASLTGSIRLINARTDTFVPIAARACTCGVFSMTADGVWTYVLDSHDPDAIALPAKATLAESVTVSASDRSLSGTVLITVVGIDDAGTIGGGDSGSVKEDVTTACSGVLIATDPDTGDAVFVAQTTSSAYGTFVLAKSGSWTYTLGAGAQALAAGTTVSDTFTARSVGGASHVVSITIAGTNDVPTITGTGTGTIAVSAAATVSGTLGISDPDTGESSFSPATTAGSYGSLTITAAGAWTYTLNTALPAVSGLSSGAKLTDRVTVISSDGSNTAEVQITIVGTGDGYSNTVLAMSPISYWMLDETSGATAKDAMGYSAGTYSDSPTLGCAAIRKGAAGAAGFGVAAASGARVVAGTGDKFSNLVTGGRAWSIAMWCKVISTANTPMSRLFAYFNSVDNGTGPYALEGRLNMTSETRLYLDIGMQNSASGIYAEGALSVTGSPVFIVATGSSGTGRKLYINGALAASSATSITNTQTGGDGLQFPATGGYSYYSPRCYLSDVAVFNREITAGEIASLYSLGAGA